MSDSGEFLAGNVPNDQLVKVNNESLDRISRLEVAIAAIAERTHDTFHDHSGPWQTCPYLTCRRAADALELTTATT